MSSTTLVAHLGVLRVRWTSMSGIEPQRTAYRRRIARLPEHRVDERPGNIHVGHGVAKLIRPRRHHLDGAIAGDIYLMAAGAGGIERRKNLFEQLALKEPQRLRRELVAPLRPFEPLLGGHLLDQILHLPPEGVKLIEFTLLDILAERLHVDEGHAGILAGLFQLPEQFFDGFEFFLDIEGLGHGELFAAGKRPLRRQFVHLIDLAETIHQPHQLPAEPPLIVILRIPEPLQLPQLLRLHSLVQSLTKLRRWLRPLGRLAKRIPRLLPHPIGLVPFEDLPPSLLQLPLDRIE